MFTICPLLSFNHYRLIYTGTVLELYYIYYTVVVPIYPMHYIYISDNGHNDKITMITIMVILKITIMIILWDELNGNNIIMYIE